MGETEFGKRWWIDGLDFLVPGDGSVPDPDPNHSGASILPELASKGLRPGNGVALMRGDGSSAWFAANSNVSDWRVDDTPEFSSEDWVAGTGGESSTLGNTVAAGYGGHYEVSSEDGATAGWDLTSVSPGKPYQVFVTWVPNALACNLTYTVSGAAPVGRAAGVPISVDQRYTPGDFVTYEGAGESGQRPIHWRSLGFYVPDVGGTITVTLSGSPGLGEHMSAIAAMALKDWTFTTPGGSYLATPTTPGLQIVNAHQKVTH